MVTKELNAVSSKRKDDMNKQERVHQKILEMISGTKKSSNVVVDSEISKSLTELFSPKNKEIAKKDPELDDKDFSVEDTRDRTETTDLNGKKVMVNPEGDAREYLAGDAKGKQLFTHAAALRYANILGKKLPASSTTYKDIINKKYGGDYQEFLIGEKMNFNGWHNPKYGRFTNINSGFGLRCADGSHILGNRYGMNDDVLDQNFGFSVRFLKE